MPSEHSPEGTAKARLFVALDLPQEAVAALVAWRAPLLRSHDGLRAVRPDALHVTLCFLGWLDEAAVAPLSEVVGGVAARAGEVGGLALAEPLWLPRRRPRVLAVGLADDAHALGRLQAELVETLADGGWCQPEARPYLPHVTVARVRSPARPSGALPGPPQLAFAGAAVTLYRSLLHPSGARYEAMFRHVLA